MADKRVRLFFALLPDAAAQQQLDVLAADAALGGRRTPRCNLHLTLHYVGPVDAKRRSLLLLAASRVRAAPFDLRLDRLGCWRRKRIYWAGCATSSPQLLFLREALRLELLRIGEKCAGENFSPHVTLRRDVRTSPQSAPMQGQDIDIAWRVNEMVLLESCLRDCAAPIYRPLSSFPLRSPAIDHQGARSN